LFEETDPPSGTSAQNPAIKEIEGSAIYAQYQAK
jgi:hypothetical protein